MGIKCGIVGLPNVGKSSLFNALSSSCVEAENYPFCTIDPNVGIVNVPDPRLDKIANIVKAKKKIYATVEFFDIAGLVAGASSGEGLGNQFLSHIRQTDAIAHLIRCFKSDTVVHVAGKIDPVSDLNTINTELILADLQSIEKSLLKLDRLVKTGDKEAKLKTELLKKISEKLDKGELLSGNILNATEKMLIKEHNLLTLKPVLYIANVDDQPLQDNKAYVELENYVAENIKNCRVIPISVELESELAQLSDEEMNEFLNDIGQSEPSLNRFIRASYDLLNLQTFFTAGEKEARAWTISKGMKAPQAAGTIHGDFERGFIKAETISYEDFILCGGELGCRDKGKLRIEGKEYELCDGDILNFRFNV